MKALVTGASGCLGSHLLERLTTIGENVRILARQGSMPSFLPGCGVEVVTGDLQDEDALKRAVVGVDVVYHCAARTVPNGTWTEFDACNIRATEQLLTAAAAAGVSRFIQVGSLGVYSPGGEAERRVNEEDGYDPYPWRRGFYTWSKIEADRVALRFEKQHTAPAVLVLRPGVLYGPRAKHFTARLHYAWRNTIMLVVGRPDMLLPLVRVENVVDALLLAGHGLGRSGEAYNIVDCPVTQSEYLAWLWNGKEQPNVFYIPFSWVSTAAKVLDWASRGRFKAQCYRLLRAGQSHVYDTTKAEQDLGWQPALQVGQVQNGVKTGQTASINEMN